MCVYMFVLLRSNSYAYTYECVYVYIYVCVLVCMYVCTNLCMYYIYMYVCI